ncbi:MAG: hypothetical protein R2787_04775 [Saprospiraceae bacterium]
MRTDLAAPITLVKYQVLSSNYKFIRPNEEVSNIQELLASYEIELSYEIKVNNKSPLWLVLYSIAVNPSRLEAQKPGYELEALVASIFDISKVEEIVPEPERERYTLTSSLAIAIHNVRACLRDLTLSAPMGPYSLPTIDIGKLMQIVSTKETEQRNGDQGVAPARKRKTKPDY